MKKRLFPIQSLCWCWVTPWLPLFSFSPLCVSCPALLLLVNSVSSSLRRDTCPLVGRRCHQGRDTRTLVGSQCHRSCPRPPPILSLPSPFFSGDSGSTLVWNNIGYIYSTTHSSSNYDWFPFLWFFSLSRFSMNDTLHILCCHSKCIAVFKYISECTVQSSGSESEPRCTKLGQSRVCTVELK